MDLMWNVAGFAVIALYIFTIRGFGPIGQPHNPLFPVWPRIGRWLMGMGWRE